jgi:hypothetical protein
MIDPIVIYSLRAVAHNVSEGTLADGGTDHKSLTFSGEQDFNTVATVTVKVEGRLNKAVFDHTQLLDPDKRFKITIEEI